MRLSAGKWTGVGVLYGSVLPSRRTSSGVGKKTLPLEEEKSYFLENHVVT
jgi:hypothetical protein